MTTLSVPATPSLGWSARGDADDLDPLDQLGRDAIDEEAAIGLAAGRAAAVDQHLGEARRQAAHLHAVIFEHVRGEGDARHALQHLADRDRFEALEIFEVVGEDRVGIVGAVAEDDLAGDDDIIRLSGFFTARLVQ